LKRFKGEAVEADNRLNTAVAAVRKAALQVVAALADRECELLRQIEEHALRYRAELLGVASWWPDAATGPIALSRAAAVLLEAPPDWDRARLMVSMEKSTVPWKAMLKRLVQGDVEADFGLQK